MRNLKFVMTRGETGKVLWFKLEPTNNEGVPEAVDLTGWTVTIRVTRNDTVLINDAACVPDPDQTANPGEGTFTFNQAQADLPKDNYLGRIKAEDPSGNIYYFPTLPNRTYFALKVLAQ